MSVTESFIAETEAILTNGTTHMTSPYAEDARTEAIKEIIVMTQYIMTIIGAIVNLATLFILREAKSNFAAGYLLLLQSQAFLDFLVCIVGTVMMLQKPMWRSGNLVFDYIICHAWHGQLLYWVWVLASIWNLVMIAYERFLAICYPFKHVDLTVERIRKLIIVAYIIGWLSNVVNPFQVRMSNGKCVSEYSIPGKLGKWVFFIFGQYIFLSYWLVPFIFFCILYGRVLKTLFARRDNSSFGESTLVNTATTQMTKTAITVTIIFIFSMSWACWHFMLGRLGLVHYAKNTLMQLIGLWLSSFNSLANPIVYFILLPAFRKATFTTLLPCLKFGKKADKNKAGVNKD